MGLLMKTQPQRSDLCSSPSLNRSPEPDAAIVEPDFQANSVDAWNETALRRRMSLADIELSLARSMARRLTAAAYNEPGLRLDLVKGEWLTAHRRRPLQPRCRTFGCTLRDLHAGLHQVASPLCKRRVVPR